MTAHEIVQTASIASAGKKKRPRVMGVARFVATLGTVVIEVTG